MALCTISFANGGSIQPDTAEIFEHLREAEVTEHPVEDGSAIADHVIVKPLRFTLTTNWTPRPFDSNYLPAGNDRPDRAFDQLTFALQYKQSLSVELDGIIYSPVILTSVTMQRVLADGDGRTIQLEGKQIQIVQGQVVTAKVAAALKSKAKPKKKKTAPTKADAEAGAAYLKQQLGWMVYYPGSGVPTPSGVTVPKTQALSIISQLREPTVPPSKFSAYGFPKF